MSNWRPEGWLDAIVKIYMDEDEDEIAWNERQFMEAGADAMLEALRKHAHREGKNLTKAQWLAFWGTNAEGSGCIVFIPDDREE